MPPSPLDREIEAKFRITDPVQAQAARTWPRLADQFALGPVTDVVHVDTYLDAPDLRLLRQGQTLRIRGVGDTVLMTAKSIDLHTPKGMHTRREVERPAPEVALDATLLHAADLPADLRAALGAQLDGNPPLRALVRLRQARAKRTVMFDDIPAAPPIAELSIDAVTVQRRAHNDRAATDWEDAVHFTTLEVELAPDTDRSILRTVALDLRARPGFAADDQNKLQQALLALRDAEAEPGAAGADAGSADHRLHMAEFCRRVWGQQLAIMLVNEAGVRFSDDIEYVHDMRVATRRARAAARLYAGFFKPQSKRVKRFIKRLRTTGRLLGRVRDLDVALDRLARYAGEGAGSAGDEGGGDDRALPKDVAALQAAWTRKRDHAHAALLAWLDSSAYRKFVVQFVQFCATPGAAVPPFAPQPGQPPPPHQVRHVLPSLILNRYEAIRAFEVLFEQAQATSKPLPIETLHALRIECKYMRYHLEFAAGLLGSEADALIDALKGLQEHLGELNDASVSSALLTEAATGEAAEYADLQARTQTALRASLPADLDAFLSAATRQRLALALAQI